MTERFNLTFTNDETSLFTWLKSQHNPSGLIKDLLIGYRNGEQVAAQKADAEPETDQVIIKALLQNFIGEDVELYGGESMFLQFNDQQTLNNRVSILMASHPKEAADVIRLAKETYPSIGAKL